MLVPHPYLCNRAGFRDNAAKLGKPGHRAKCRDCPGQTGTLGNYEKEQLKLSVEEGSSLYDWHKKWYGHNRTSRTGCAGSASPLLVPPCKISYEGSATIRFGVRDFEITDFKHGFPDFSLISSDGWLPISDKISFLVINFCFDFDNFWISKVTMNTPENTMLFS